MLKLENRPVRRKVQVEIKKHTKANKDQPVVMTNPKYWMRPDLIAARGLKLKMRDAGRLRDIPRLSAEICAVDWKGPKQ